ncbi:MAG: MgtC/SapB family protein [Scytolyngbya sp. HA4215-MV1]|jgi:putative Mg2+ transporter-C (MgtC) family protein|nr:MgtC/SapB family protein [Scytolyngbya sp. HA4215-MV1]
MSSVFIDANNWGVLIGRLTLSLCAGGVIGWNRQLHNKAAGLRTYMLVSLGSALFVLVPLQIEPRSSEALSRAIQGIATGVGFLGAGEILHRSRQETSQPRVVGLTSAAAVWVAAALGIAAGCGLWQLSLVGAFFTLLVLSLVKRLEKTGLFNESENM